MSQINSVATLVVGGGIGGLAAALALAQQGQQVHVIERAQAFSEVGAGLQLAPNASRALDHLGVLAKVWKTAVFPQRLVWMDALSGQNVTAMDLGDKFQACYGYPYVVMHRSDLLEALLGACLEHPRITLETNRHVTTVTDHGDTADARCADGSVYRCDVLIGADGLRSAVRSALAGAREPVCSHYVAYRGTIPMERMSAHAGSDNVMMWTGPDMHLVQYPVRRGELYNQVAVFRSDRYAPGHDDWGTREEMAERFAPACPEVRDALTMIATNRRWPLFDREPISQWTRGRIALLGDAAHPMLQYLAQGAAQALEDACTLANAFAANPDDPAAALAAYAGVRRPRTARVQHTARIFGDIIHMEPVGAGVRNALLADRQADDYSPVNWLYAAQT
ncbi:FAD-dependent monooxygenase [Cupriavidus sp. UYPR2.512]|uniref:FAD-dependent monooxygenase n=1 Tax=Cupriavidus sp. UYPR2.512 TaxID=1080187 RepID=UPI000367BEA8|nr:FAD-dependent monooxygenase [Cupriavidus sp. UYPR2.512]UIF90273.1 FAD-dependent monooxygenase [Cupriavidus necator]